LGMCPWWGAAGQAARARSKMQQSHKNKIK
jgi:hypothetical protein